MSESTLQGPIICLMGPTASGKTALAVELVQHLPCEIISVDSAMVYRGMDIGTAKPTADILAIAPHRLLDIRDPADSYSAGQFCADAKREIDAIFALKKIPLLVGGTMLYFHALQNGLATLPPADPAVRAKILQTAEIQGWTALHQQLQKIDPIAAQRIHPNDPQRLQRALEVHAITGKTLTELCSNNADHLFGTNIINIALLPDDRLQLQVQIAARFQTMLQQGLLDEVQALYQRGDLVADLPAIRAVGYRQVWDYLDGKLSYAEMQERAIIATRQLAKRQLTWLRNWEEKAELAHPLHRFSSHDPQLVDKVISLLTNASTATRNTVI